MWGFSLPWLVRCMVIRLFTLKLHSVMVTFHYDLSHIICQQFQFCKIYRLVKEWTFHALHFKHSKCMRMGWTIATLALGSRPRQKGLKGAGQEECENEDSHSQMSFPFRSWSPGGLLNLQRMIVEVKTPRIEEFFISLEIYWNVSPFHRCSSLKLKYIVNFKSTKVHQILL